MSGYVEVMIEGNCRAFIEASNIAGVITSSGMSADQPATPESPMSILLRNGNTVPGVYGVSPNRLLIHIEGAKALIRKIDRMMICAYIDHIEDFEALLVRHLSREMGLGDPEYGEAG